MVGHQVLVLSIEVRILVPQPLTASTSCVVIMQLVLARDAYIHSKRIIKK